MRRRCRVVQVSITRIRRLAGDGRCPVVGPLAKRVVRSGPSGPRLKVSTGYAVPVCEYAGDVGGHRGLYG